MLLLVWSLLLAQLPPPPPPAFMGMKGLPLACLDKPPFEEDGLEFFVCNGGAGLGRVRKKSDPAQTVWVAEVDIALNLNMQVAKAQCGKGRFGVRSALRDGWARRSGRMSWPRMDADQVKIKSKAFSAFVVDLIRGQ